MFEIPKTNLFLSCKCNDKKKLKYHVIPLHEHHSYFVVCTRVLTGRYELKSI